MAPTVLSLFAGIGGIDLGLEALGCETRWYSEIDPYASRVMAARFPNAVNLGDVTTIEWEALDARPDIICGGFPCQDISLAGKGAGLEGDRSGLWRFYADAVRVLGPRGVLVENVAALTARGLDRVLADLAACGFDAEWDCVPAAAVGAPHLRDRIFVVAWAAGGQRAVADTERIGVERWGGPANVAGAARDDEGEGLQRKRGGDAAFDRGADVADADGERREGLAAGDCGDGGVDEQSGHDAAGRGAASGSGPDPDRAGRREQRWPQPARAKLATTERDGWWQVEPAVGRVVDGFPGRVDRLRCLGNAVVPAVAEHVGSILLERMEGR